MELIFTLAIILVIYFIFRKRAKTTASKTYKDSRGYYRFKDADKPVHRWAAEKKLGRKLRKAKLSTILTGIRAIIVRITFGFSAARMNTTASIKRMLENLVNGSVTKI